MAALLEALGPWTRAIAGLVLIVLEMLAPGVFLVWLGLAAVMTAVASWAFDLSWQAQALVFAALAVAAVALGRTATRHREDEDPSRPALNRRGQDLVGRVFALDEAIAGGSGRIRVGDSSWRVSGPDAPAGARVRVVGVEGATLVVEPA